MHLKYLPGKTDINSRLSLFETAVKLAANGTEWFMVDNDLEKIH